MKLQNVWNYYFQGSRFYTKKVDGVFYCDEDVKIGKDEIIFNDVLIKFFDSKLDYKTLKQLKI